MHSFISRVEKRLLVFKIYGKQTRRPTILFNMQRTRRPHSHPLVLELVSTRILASAQNLLCDGFTIGSNLERSLKTLQKNDKLARVCALNVRFSREWKGSRKAG